MIMTVYVDHVKIPYGRMKMSHMMADTSAELIEVADSLGLKLSWLQKSGTPYEHFDVSESKRQEGIDRLGVVPVDGKWLIRNLVWPKFGVSPLVPKSECSREPKATDAYAGAKT